MMSQEELERIYDEHGGAVFALFVSFAKSEADARDLLQDWLVKIGRGLDSLSGIRNPRAYLIRVAHRMAVDWFRRARTRRSYEGTAGSETQPDRFMAEVDPDREEMRRELERSLSQLPEEQRLIVEWKLWDGLTFEEIASILGIPANTAASRYRYGIGKLRVALKPFYEELKR